MVDLTRNARVATRVEKHLPGHSDAHVVGMPWLSTGGVVASEFSSLGRQVSLDLHQQGSLDRIVEAEQLGQLIVLVALVRHRHVGLAQLAVRLLWRAV